MMGPRCRIRSVALVATLTLGLTVALIPAITAVPATLAAGHSLTLVAAPAGERWNADLSVVDRDDVNVRRTAAGLRLREARSAGRSPRSAVAEGMLLTAPRTLSRPATRVRAEITARVPAGATVEAQVRGWRVNGWAEWRGRHRRRRLRPAGQPGADPGSAHHAGRRRHRDGTRCPARRRRGRRRLRRHARPHLPGVRIGLVGEQTANGRTVQPRDHFVALPSRRGLSPLNSGDYTVRVCTTTGSCCEYAPVWDVGPWNTRDDYWNRS
ncbi:hypothetical protein OG470_14970 [Micromonospora sp. NBC_00389]|uniref:hypothetical protein n=1 Tax=Micromonospora sp. NBC_00389 TaxID=2903586 RepID=UPI002E242D29